MRQVLRSSSLRQFTRTGFGRFGLIAGYTSQNPEARDPLLNPKFRTRYFILGGEWFFAEKAKLYTESRIDLDSVTAAGEPGYDVFTMASVTTSHGEPVTSNVMASK